MDKITLDRAVFKALASDTRLDILKALDVRQKTVTELAKELGLNKATVFEHLEKLAEVNLIQKLEDERKWVYWQLTWTGRRLLHPEKITLALLLSSAMGTLLTALAAVWMWVRSGPGGEVAVGSDAMYADGDFRSRAYAESSNGSSSGDASSAPQGEAAPAMSLKADDAAGGEQLADTAASAADPAFLAVAIVMGLLFLALVGYAAWYWRKRRAERAAMAEDGAPPAA